MRRKLAVYWVSLAMVFGLVVIVDITMDFTPSVMGGTTRYVNETGTGGAYTKIQDAINASSDGDTVFVYNGTYYENVVVNKTINLTGEDRNNTIIEYSGDLDAVYVSVNWVNITGFTINGSGPISFCAGIKLDNVQNCRITNNNISMNNENGIFLDSSSNNIIKGNNASSNCFSGIWLHSSSNNTVTDNNVSDNDDGITLQSSLNNSIRYNNISSNDWNGIDLSLSSSNNTISDNTVWGNGNPLGGDGISIASSSNNIITGNNVSSNKDYGISFDSSSNNTITYNNVSNNGDGIYSSSSNQNTIKEDIFLNNGYGIVLDDSDDWIIRGNTVMNNDGSGIYLMFGSNNNMISNNTILDNDYGINFWEGCRNNTIIGNNVSNNKYHGINIYWGCYENNVTGNYVYSNKLTGIYIFHCSDGNNITGNIVSSNNLSGIVIIDLCSRNNVIGNYVSSNNENGIHIESFSSWNNITGNNVLNNSCGISIQAESPNNHIYHNNIIKNTNQAYDDTNNGNQWDNGYPLGGNYWSDYGGVDNLKGPNQNIPGSDGIGDMAYSNIDGGMGAEDKYPLWRLYSPLENYTILKPGWYLISIPLIQEEQNLTRVLGSIDGWYDAVQWYDNEDKIDPWMHYKVGKPYGNDLFEINETMGFWIHITQPGDTIFQYNGTEPTINQTIPLHPGWNLVGYPSLTYYNRTEGLNNLTFGMDVDSIWTYNAATQKWKELGPSDCFETGRGYWVHAKLECTWEVPL